jgi:hypothetical protein
MIYQAQHRKLETKQHVPRKKTGMKSGVQEGYAVPAPLTATVVLLLLQTR